MLSLCMTEKAALAAMDRSTVALTICRKRQANFVCVRCSSSLNSAFSCGNGPGFPTVRLYRNKTHSSDRERRAGLVLSPVFSIATNSRQEVADAGDACARPYIPSAQKNHWIRLNSHVKKSSSLATCARSFLKYFFITPFACVCHNVVESYARPSGFTEVRHTHFTTSLLGRTLSHSPLVTHVTLHAVGKSLNEKQKKVFI